jgi:hypothetical protein
MMIILQLRLMSWVGIMELLLEQLMEGIMELLGEVIIFLRVETI